MDGQEKEATIQDNAAFLAGEHDFQVDIERLASSQLIGTILETVMMATRMRFAGVARVTADRWIACRTADQINFEIREGDEIKIESTFCQTVRETSEMILFSDVASDELYRGHPIAAAFGIVSYASVPIFRADGSFFGTLCAIDTEPKDINNTRTVSMLKMFADLIGQTLDTEERLEAQEELLEHERRLSRVQEEFTAILGHDLRNPVAALKSGVRQLEKEPLTDRGRQLLGLMRSSLHRMHELVDNMMLHAKSRLGSGISIAAQPDAPLVDAITHVVQEIRISAPERDIELDLAFGAPVACDAERLAQAVSNLVSNAINHGEPETPVHVCGRSGTTEITIAVANRGKHIPEEEQQELFQPFRRGNTAEASGLGLGLHIASSIARAHGGSLSVSCHEGTTTFTLAVPTLPRG